LRYGKGEDNPFPSFLLSPPDSFLSWWPTSDQRIVDHFSVLKHPSSPEKHIAHRVKRRVFKHNPSEIPKSAVITLPLHKNYMKREVGVLKNLYSGTFKRFATQFSSI